MTNVLPTYPRSKLEFTHGVGSYLYTKTGEKFLDFGNFEKPSKIANVLSKKKVVQFAFPFFPVTHTRFL